MFDNLTQRLSQSLRQITGKARLTEDNIKETLRDVRRALLEADVALPVVQTFIESVKKRAVGKEVSKSLRPGQQLVKIVRDELERTMGGTVKSDKPDTAKDTSKSADKKPKTDKTEQKKDALNLATQPPAVILMAGLQGAGKTSTIAKLAHYLQEQHKKSVAVVSVDVYRPAAIEQLEVLAHEVEADYFPSSADQKPMAIAKAALKQAKVANTDVLLVDTAGRLAIDEVMMAEIRDLHAVLKPVETLFVVDAMTGQDAANTAKAFHDALPLTGVILTKVDADTRGGAALSVRQITGKPIKFIGVGEKSAALDVFHADRMASRILGMGDMISLIEDAQQKFDKKKAKKLVKKIKKGKKFDLEDMREQLRQTKNMGGIGAMLDKLPGMGMMGGSMSAKIKAAQAQAGNRLDNSALVKMEALINSMTSEERRYPDLLNGSRKRRITKGSGASMQDLSRLLKQYKQMGKVMKKMKTKSGAADIMRSLGGNLPPGDPRWR